MEVNDPWNVDTLEEFLYYCCPECKDQRMQCKEDFIKHALDKHPKSKISFSKMLLVKKENSIELDHGKSIDIQTFETACDIEYLVKSENNEDWHNNSKTINHLKKEQLFENKVQAEEVQSKDTTVIEDSKDFECKSCSKSFSSAQYLRKHIYNIHEGHKDFNCKYCVKSFSQKSSLKNHIHTVHLKEHLGTIHNKDYKSESISQEDYKSESISQVVPLKIHKNYTCKSCSKSFSSAQYLKKHIHNVHEGHKDFNCDSCGKSFSQKSTLKNHIHIVHEGHKDFKCESCSKLFSCATNLKKHGIIILFMYTYPST